jgi:hypothetical protein
MSEYAEVEHNQCLQHKATDFIYPKAFESRKSHQSHVSRYRQLIIGASLPWVKK